jgi:hypothetical protein
MQPIPFHKPDKPLSCLIAIADQIACTRYDHEGDDARVRQTLAYASALLGEDEARRVMLHIEALNDNLGQLEVVCRAGFQRRWRRAVDRVQRHMAKLHRVQKPFEDHTPCVTHETDGSVGGPWRIRCDVDNFDFGGFRPETSFCLSRLG